MDVEAALVLLDRWLTLVLLCFADVRLVIRLSMNLGGLPSEGGAYLFGCRIQISVSCHLL